MNNLFQINYTFQSGIFRATKISSAKIMLGLIMALGFGIVSCDSNPNTNNSSTTSTTTPTTTPEAATTPSTVVDPLLDQAKKAKESEGKLYLGSMERAQQAYFLEKGKFATSVDELQLGIKEDTPNYTYKIESNDANQVIMTATSKQPELKSFTGVVVVEKPGTPEAITMRISCATDSASTTPPAITEKIASAAAFKCPSGSTQL